MIEVGNLSPISKDINVIEPKIAIDQDVKAFLLSEKIGIVLDANFLQDDTVNYELKSTLKFDNFKSVIFYLNVFVNGKLNLNIISPYILD